MLNLMNILTPTAPKQGSISGNAALDDEPSEITSRPFNECLRDTCGREQGGFTRLPQDVSESMDGPAEDTAARDLEMLGSLLDQVLIDAEECPDLWDAGEWPQRSGFELAHLSEWIESVSQDMPDADVMPTATSDDGIAPFVDQPSVAGELSDQEHVISGNTQLPAVQAGEPVGVDLEDGAPQGLESEVDPVSQGLPTSVPANPVPERSPLPGAVSSEPVEPSPPPPEPVKAAEPIETDPEGGALQRSVMESDPVSQNVPPSEMAPSNPVPEISPVPKAMPSEPVKPSPPPPEPIQAAEPIETDLETGALQSPVMESDPVLQNTSLHGAVPGEPVEPPEPVQIAEPVAVHVEGEALQRPEPDELERVLQHASEAENRPTLTPPVQPAEPAAATKPLPETNPAVVEPVANPALDTQSESFAQNFSNSSFEQGDRQSAPDSLPEIVPVENAGAAAPSPVVETAPAEASVSVPPSRIMVPAVLLEQLDRVVLHTMRGDDKSMQIDLEPASLGRVQVHCRDTAQGLAVEIHVQSPAVRSLLTGNESDLRAALEAQGVQLGRFSVSCGDEGQSGQKQSFTNQQPDASTQAPMKSGARTTETATQTSHYIPISGTQRWIA